MSKKLTTEIFTEKANIIHNNLYNYSLVNYVNYSTKVEIICKLHSSFLQRPNDHLGGAGCPECSGHKRIITDSFIEKAILKHNNKYDYSLSKFTTSKEKVKIICKRHGIFEQIAHNHLMGSTCYKCAKEISTIKISSNTNDFIKRAIIIHNNKYDYSKVNYINNHTKIIIICPIHNEFNQQPNSHLAGQGCSKCKGNCISKIEVQWLDFLNIPQEYRQKSITINSKKYRIDAFNPITNTVYEFYGDYWHGNPKIYNPAHINTHNKFLFRELYNKTLLREEIYKNFNYKIISIWEADFKLLINKNGPVLFRDTGL